MSALPAEPIAYWTIADLESFPDDGKRYEIINGDLFVSKQPHWHHQQSSGLILSALNTWCAESGLGQTSHDPGLIFDDRNAVVPDVVWVSNERLQDILGEDGKLHDAPDLVVEVLSPGPTNIQRDRDTKRRLYSARGVREYWVVDWQLKSLQVYRREEGALTLVGTFYPEDELTSPLLPGFKVSVARLFPG
ncbi:MAG: Uma2 family endonuclease [Anaerolineales bacterium]